MLKPVLKRVIIEIENLGSEHVTESGIVLSKPNSTTTHAKVIDVGDKVEFVKKNDKVLIPTGRYFEISHEGKTYNLIEEKDIIAVIED